MGDLRPISSSESFHQPQETKERERTLNQRNKMKTSGDRDGSIRPRRLSSARQVQNGRVRKHRKGSSGNGVIRSSKSIERHQSSALEATNKTPVSRSQPNELLIQSPSPGSLHSCPDAPDNRYRVDGMSISQLTISFEEQAADLSRCDDAEGEANIDRTSDIDMIGDCAGVENASNNSSYASTIVQSSVRSSYSGASAWSGDPGRNPIISRTSIETFLDTPSTTPFGREMHTSGVYPPITSQTVPLVWVHDQHGRSTGTSIQNIDSSQFLAPSTAPLLADDEIVRTSPVSAITSFSGPTPLQFHEQYDERDVSLSDSLTSGQPDGAPRSGN